MSEKKPTQTNKSSKFSYPSVLSFAKHIVTSDALMFEEKWEDIESNEFNFNIQNATRLLINDKTIRGTIAHVTATEKQQKDANIQTVDFCCLSHDKDTLVLKFTIKFLGDIATPSACDNNDFQCKLCENIKSYIEEFQLTELSRRYATNLANLRFLWRNRIGVEYLKVKIEILNKHENKNENIFTFEGHNFNLKQFDSTDQKLNKLSNLIATALASDDDFLLLRVTAFAKIGEGQDVYPSEEFIQDKENKKKGKKTKVLYSLDKQAAMHSQKIGNAVRTIDTWYSEDNNMPIAIEPYGSVTTIGKAFRSNNNDFYTIFKKFVSSKYSELADEEKHFIVAMLIRGGVFGESSKEA
jgi:CRISPR-associated protein Csy3